MAYNMVGEYTRHPYFSYFKNMIERAKQFGLDCDYILGLESLNKFINDIGPIPEGIKTPTVGRKDHSKGYILGNFEWQPKSENSREALLRTLTTEQRSKGGHKTAELGKTAFQTGIAGRASAESSNHPSKTGKSGCHTGVAGRASAESPNHNTNYQATCPECGRTGKGPRWKNHIDNLFCRSKSNIR